MRDTRRTQRLLRFSYALVCLVVISAAMLVATGARAAEHAPEVRNSSRAPVRFEANRDQTDEQVKYLARATNYNIFLAENEADIVLHHETKPSGTVARGKMIVVQAYANVLRLRFANSNRPTKIVPSFIAAAVVIRRLRNTQPWPTEVFMPARMSFFAATNKKSDLIWIFRPVPIRTEWSSLWTERRESPWTRRETQWCAWENSRSFWKGPPSSRYATAVGGHSLGATGSNRITGCVS